MKNLKKKKNYLDEMCAPFANCLLEIYRDQPTQANMHKHTNSQTKPWSETRYAPDHVRKLPLFETIKKKENTKINKPNEWMTHPSCNVMDEQGNPADS